jgi:hypothetical protein
MKVGDSPMHRVTVQHVVLHAEARRQNIAGVVVNIQACMAIVRCMRPSVPPVVGKPGCLFSHEEIVRSIALTVTRSNDATATQGGSSR